MVTSTRLLHMFLYWTNLDSDSKHICVEGVDTKMLTPEFCASKCESTRIVSHSLGIANQEQRFCLAAPTWFRATVRS